MAQMVPQEILDELTDVVMPRRMLSRTLDGHVECSGMQIPVYRSEALVLGSGAAGLRAAIELKRRNVDVLVATQTLFWGTSACSGSDKQTLHTVATTNKGDNYIELAKALSAGGAMDADTAYVEAIGSTEAFVGLKYIGLPIPEDRFGGVLRYKTDHDEAGRATSCGPRTSRLMVKVLAEEALRLDVPFVNRCTGLRILKDEIDGKLVTTGLLAVKADGRSDTNPYGLVIFESPAVVLATGGPGELYRDSVYPVHCFGSLGLALEAGIELTNLTESQFGIGTRRDEFPWNLSGTYVQAMPYIYSVDDAGHEYNFLSKYYRTTQELVSNIFRKGYQWPFHSTRTLNFQSSLLDIAVYEEARCGRTVYMDFLRNPEPATGDAPFSLERLDDDVHAYLKNNDALLERPIDRLRRMNPLAIELYKHNKVDLESEPLPFNINNQHMNGGVSVDIWAQSSLSGCYAIGEVAGTHGVTRPGGAALNAGQVFGIRCAKHIHANRNMRNSVSSNHRVIEALSQCAGLIRRDLKNINGLLIRNIRKEIQARMSDKAGFVCVDTELGEALDAARALNVSIGENGIRIDNVAQVANAMLWHQTALTSEAVLAALEHYVRNGGGSRGARLVCSKTGTEVPSTRYGPLDHYRFITEKEADRTRQICVRLVDGKFEVSEKVLRGMEDPGVFYFEKNWAPFLTDQIYRDGYTAD